MGRSRKKTSAKETRNKGQKAPNTRNVYFHHKIDLMQILNDCFTSIRQPVRETEAIMGISPWACSKFPQTSVVFKLQHSHLNSYRNKP